MSNWISVKDKLPDRAAYYMVIDKDLGVIISLASAYFSLKAQRFSYEYNVTHWQPLPMLLEE